MVSTNFAELAANKFITQDILNLRQARETANSIAGWLSVWIVRNSKTFMENFGDKKATDFQDINIPLLLGKTNTTITGTVSLIPELASLDPQRVVVLKTKNGIKISYGFDNVRMIPFWLALPESNFNEVIEYISNAFKEESKNNSHYLQEEENFNKNLLKNITEEFTQGNITAEEYQIRSNEYIVAIDAIRNRKLNTRRANRTGLDDIRDEVHANYVRNGEVSEDNPFLSTATRIMIVEDENKNRPRRAGRRRQQRVVNDSPFMW